MKFGIVGAGAMGCLLGSLLVRAGNEVWLVDIREEQVSRIRDHGLTVISKGKPEIIRIRATTNTRDVGICDVVIISTKFHHTRTAIQDAGSLIDDETLVMTIQNGIGNVETISEFVDQKQILFGFTTLGSVTRGPGEIEATFSDEAVTHIWPLTGEPDQRVKDVVNVFKQAHLSFHLSPDVREQIWKKLCLNASFSVPLAIPRLKCGDFINQPASLDLIRALVSEIAAVANKEGVDINPEEAYEYVVGLARQAPNHLPSPLIDVINHRKTEIDCLNGAIVEKARSHGIEVPYNTAIYHLIKIMEDTYDKSIQHQ
ncbi:MAG: 2-dehydropantoate 2-reductase [Proteobacteria bacterium]|nr:2-dehydropantoate 2-reductase [Pseudomonadota bacterium]